MKNQFQLNCGGKQLDLTSPKVMGVLNITPDSFYANSRCTDLDDVLQRAEAMLAAGADILDVGGESTSKMVKKYGYTNDSERYVGGQKAEDVVGDSADTQQELERVIPVVEALTARFDCIVSVDTSSSQVMKESACAGAGMINDIRALERDGALQAALETELPVVLMHSLVDHPEPGFVPHYDNLVDTVVHYLQARVQVCEQAGFERQRLLIDPGFGGGLFGKTPAYDLSLLKHLEQIGILNLPILVGVSRKSFIGAMLDKAPEQRLAGSLAAAMLAAQSGANILRVHDVAETVDVLRIIKAVQQAQ